MNDEIGLVDYVAGGGKLTSPANANARYRGEIMRLMAVFVELGDGWGIRFRGFHQSGAWPEGPNGRGAHGAR